MAPLNIKCKHCPKKYPADKLAFHELACVANKPHMCELCSQCFASPQGVRTHQAKFHTADERQTRYKCRFCGQGSDDASNMKRHESQHEEMGGPGFSRRSRSRSRAPVGAPDGRRSRSRSYVAEPTPVFHPQARAPSRSRGPPTNPQARAPSRSRGPSTNRAENASTNRINWANSHPNDNVQRANHVESSSKDTEMRDVDDITNGDQVNSQALPSSVQIDQDGIIRLALIDPEAAIRRLQNYEKTIKALNAQIRSQNKKLREMASQNGFQLETDVIENLLTDFEKEFGPLEE